MVVSIFGISVSFAAGAVLGLILCWFILGDDPDRERRKRK